MFAEFFFSGARYTKQGQGEESAKVSGTHSTISNARSASHSLSRKAAPKNLFSHSFSRTRKNVSLMENMCDRMFPGWGSLFMLRLEIVAFQAAKAIARNYLRPLHIARRILFGVKSVGMRILANLAIQLCVICSPLFFCRLGMSRRVRVAITTKKKAVENLMQF